MNIRIHVRFRTTDECGRDSGMLGKFYSCPMLVDDKAYDCRLLIEGIKIELGIYYEIPVKFLNKDLVLPKLYVGKQIQLWEGRPIADGEVTKIP